MTPRQLAELAQEDGRGAVDKLHALVLELTAERDAALARADKLAQLVQAAVLIADAYTQLCRRCTGTLHDPSLLTEGLPGAGDATDLVLAVEALDPIAGARGGGRQRPG